MKVRILDIVRGTTVDGPGFRTAIYMAGCEHGCPGCHNPQSHEENNGELIDIDDLMNIIREEDFDVTLTGGDPLMHPEVAAEIARRVKELNHSVWLYTGYTYEQIIADKRLADVLKFVDVIVDGPFISSLKDKDLQFRGSSNQRIIHISHKD